MVQFNKDALDELKRCKNKIDKEVPEEVLNDLWLATSPSLQMSLAGSHTLRNSMNGT